MEVLINRKFNWNKETIKYPALYKVSDIPTAEPIRQYTRTELHIVSLFVSYTDDWCDVIYDRAITPYYSIRLNVWHVDMISSRGRYLETNDVGGEEGGVGRHKGARQQINSNPHPLPPKNHPFVAHFNETFH